MRHKPKKYAEGGDTFVLSPADTTAAPNPTLSTFSGASGGYPFVSGSSDASAQPSNNTTNVNIGSQQSEPVSMFNKGGIVKGRRGDGICQRGHTKGRMV